MCLSQRVWGAGRCLWVVCTEVYPRQLDMTVWDPGDKFQQETLIGKRPRAMVAEAKCVDEIDGPGEAGKVMRE